MVEMFPFNIREGRSNHESWHLMESRRASHLCFLIRCQDTSTKQHTKEHDEAFHRVLTISNVSKIISSNSITSKPFCLHHLFLPSM